MENSPLLTDTVRKSSVDGPNGPSSLRSSLLPKNANETQKMSAHPPHSFGAVGGHSVGSQAGRRAGGSDAE